MGEFIPEGQYYPREPIAIVGSGCRFPGGASSPSKLWDLLKSPRDIVQEIPSTRFSTKAFHHTDSQHHGSSNVQHAYLFEEDPRVFDRDFFGINPKEAESMDPQQRILLETVYEGVESAGYTIQQLRGSPTGVFVGVMSLDYQFVAMRGLDSLPQYHATGAAMSILANRISYFYDWKGPSVAIDTACSSSLVAMHQAVLALRNSDVKMAVAAGTNVILGPEPFIAESKLNMLSPNGRSNMWDTTADGYTRGEGICVVVLKTLSQALADNDHIECVIRETGVNSDGRTPGITMPSAEAQAALIRSTYEKCGLDLTLESDRPQYFEAHGTGTPAGDPIEAEAIHNVFFSNASIHPNDHLLVGSIKTIIGHTEGTAGLAGVLKASLAVQHGQIPANLHFNELNPNIKPYYNNLRIPVALETWPKIPEGCPRRVSVNSFGFGGTNAHAIIESWSAPRQRQDSAASTPFGGGLFVMSANSAQALVKKATLLATYLRDHPNIDLDRLSFTLFRRSSLPFRAAFSAISSRQLANKLEANVNTLKGTSRTSPIVTSLPPRILGIFTGQGAQWATMGKELYQVSEVFRSSMEKMQRSLEGLPSEDRPNWSLADELRAPADSSRVGKATVSQPLCTALQVALVDTLHAAGVELAAVVGHSSGEIAAAYAAGYLDAYDAIRVAYYRGLHSHHAQGPEGKRGKMMAVGLSIDQASRFCNDFGGALKVAASNSQRSCTLSGDTEAIDQAKARLQENGTFARILEVDTAYHSHHMQPCAAPYLNSLQGCGIKVYPGSKACPWYSSVWGSNGRSRSFNDEKDSASLTGQYWVDNLTQTVLFSQAVNRAITESHVFDLVLEIGPHPALKGPTNESVKALVGFELPYSGVLRRQEGAVEAFCDALGLIWKLFPSTRDFVDVSKAFSIHAARHQTILKNLPTYPWDHDNTIWHESRASRLFRTQDQPRHALLGHATVHGSKERTEVHWRQVLKLNELPWLRGHRIMDQCLFPATGYVAMAHEAAIRLAEDEAIGMVELHNVEIHRAMNLEEDSTGLETLFIMRVTGHSKEAITADFACYSAPVDAGSLNEVLPSSTAQLTGKATLLLGAPDEDILPPRNTPELPLVEMDQDAFYGSLSELGYSYSGDFQAVSMLRRLGHAVVSVPCTKATSLIRKDLHPATLDTAIHGIYAGITVPGDQRLRAVYLPTLIDCIRISTGTNQPSSDLSADSFVTLHDSRTVSGDINLFNSITNQTHIQIQGIHMTSVPGSQKPERSLYAGETWHRDASSGIDPKEQAIIPEERHILAALAIRITLFYCRKLSQQINSFEVMLMGKQRKLLIAWIQKTFLPAVDAGAYADISPEWASDTEEDLKRLEEGFKNEIGVKIAHALGQNLPKILRGMTTPAKVFSQNDLLKEFYDSSVGYHESRMDLSVLVGQLAHRYPHMKVLEIGAGHGASTSAVLKSLVGRCATYTCTDSSPDMIPREAFEGWPGKSSFAVFDIEKDMKSQGMSDESFDLIIAANTLSSTKELAEALKDCRKLLRPGGYLMLMEVTKEHLPVQLIKALLHNTGSSSDNVCKVLDVESWDALLRDAGFAGVDTSSSQSFCSIMIAQAVNGAVQTLRNPLSNLDSLPQLGEVVLITSPTSKEHTTQLVSQAQEVLTADGQTNVTCNSGLENIKVPPDANVLLLCDLDAPVFENMNEEAFTGLQEVVQNAKSVLWVSSGGTTGESPYATMALGWCRSIRIEHPNLKLQFLDVANTEHVDASVLINHLLRLIYHDQPQFEEVMWAHESELRLENGALYTPRFHPLDELNQLHNADAFDNTHPVAIREPGLAVVVDEDGNVLQTQIDAGPGPAQHQIEVSASSLAKLNLQDGRSAYIVIGNDISSGQKLLALSNINGSTLNITDSDILHRWEGDMAMDHCVHLNDILSILIAESVLHQANGQVWIHNASGNMREALEHVASQRNITLHRTTSDKTEKDASFIHPYITERDLHALIPKDVRTFINFDEKDRSFTALVRKVLPHIKITQHSMAAPSSSGLALPFDQDTLTSFIHSHMEKPLEHLPAFKPSQRTIIPIHELPQTPPQNLSLTTILTWTNPPSKIPALLTPTQKPLFSLSKSYLLIGLTTSLGISLTQWMLTHGAQHIILASRTPSIPPATLTHLTRTGAQIHPLALDICSPASLATAYAQISTTMPPLGGIMNGAASWHDALFLKHTFSDFSRVLAPKVEGTRNIVEWLDDNALNSQIDFLVFFSSVVAQAGNAGQSAYAAANMYMQGVVRQRRRTGLAAGIVHLGRVVGVGYVARHERRGELEKGLGRSMEGVGEEDLCEAVGRVVGGWDEVVVGMKRGLKGEWKGEARLVEFHEGEEGGEEVVSGSASIRAQLEATRGDVDVCLEVLVSGFRSAVESMLYMKEGQIDVGMSVAGLGIDSLVAIRMREWFQQEVGVEVSVIKVLSVNTSLTELCRDVLAAWRRLGSKTKG